MVTDMGLSYAAVSRLSTFFRRSSGGGRGGGFWGGSLMLSPVRFGGSVRGSIGSQCSPWIAACNAKVQNHVQKAEFNVNTLYTKAIWPHNQMHSNIDVIPRLLLQVTVHMIWVWYEVKHTVLKYCGMDYHITLISSVSTKNHIHVLKLEFTQKGKFSYVHHSHFLSSVEHKRRMWTFHRMCIWTLITSYEGE